jgi:hypothetical protein
VKQVLIRKGPVYTEHVPDPALDRNSILVKVTYSCVSAGTERESVSASQESLLAMALLTRQLKG